MRLARPTIRFLIAALTALLILIVPRQWPAGSTWALAMGLAGLTVLIAAADRSDAALWRLIGGAAAIHLSAALFLYFASARQWPLFQSLQHAEPGFWNFAMDAVATHRYALGILGSWKTGAAYPVFTSGAIEYHLWVAALYRWFGPHPLNGILVNIFCSVLQVILAVWIVRKFARPSQAIRAGWLVALWPSGILWSTQLLKDSLCGLLVLGVLAASMQLWGSPQKNLRSIGSKLVWWTVLVIGIAAVTKLRSYMGMSLALSVLLTFGIAGLWVLRKKELRLFFHGTGIALMASLSMVIAYQCPYPQHWFMIAYSEPETVPARKNVKELVNLRANYLEQVRAFSPVRVFIETLSGRITFEKPAQVMLGTPEQAIIEHSKNWSVTDESHPQTTPQKASAPNWVQPVRIFEYWPLKHFKLNWEGIQLWTNRHRPPSNEPVPSKITLPDNIEQAVFTHPAWVMIEQPDGTCSTIEKPIRVTLEKPTHMDLQYSKNWRIEKTVSSRPTRVFQGQHSRPDFGSVETAATLGENRATLGENRATLEENRATLEENSWTNQIFQLWPLKDFEPSRLFLQNQINATMNAFGSEVSLYKLMGVRRGILSEGGRTRVYASERFDTPSDLIRFIPKALLIAWLSPFPNQWLDTLGTSGVFRIFGGVETILFYLFLPWILRGSWQMIRQKQAGGFVILTFIGLCSLILGLFIPNVGTLFRLRLPMTLFCLLVGAVGLPSRSDSTAGCNRYV